MVKESQKAKKHVKAAWARMGLRLPDEVVDHQPPYCRRMEYDRSLEIDDDFLMAMGRDVQGLEAELDPHGREFAGKYQNDLGYLAAAEVAGLDQAVRNKVLVDKELLGQGRSASLDYLEEKSAEFFSEPGPSGEKDA
jgi:hypothetical protein